MLKIKCKVIEGFASPVLESLGADPVASVKKSNHTIGAFLVLIHQQIYGNTNSVNIGHNTHSVSYVTEESEHASFTIHHVDDNLNAWLFIFIRHNAEPSNTHVCIIIHPEMLVTTSMMPSMISRNFVYQRYYKGLYALPDLDVELDTIFQLFHQPLLGDKFQGCLDADAELNSSWFNENSHYVRSARGWVALNSRVFSRNISLQSRRQSGLYHLTGTPQEVFKFFGVPLEILVEVNQESSLGEFSTDGPRTTIFECTQRRAAYMDAYRRGMQKLAVGCYMQGDMGANVLKFAYEQVGKTHHVLQNEEGAFGIVPFGYIADDKNNLGSLCLYFHKSNPRLWFLAQVINPYLHFNDREFNIWVSPELWQASPEYTQVLVENSGVALNRTKYIDRKLLPERVHALVAQLLQGDSQINLSRAELCARLSPSKHFSIENVTAMLKAYPAFLVNMPNSSSTYQALAKALSPDAKKFLRNITKEAREAILAEERAVPQNSLGVNSEAQPAALHQNGRNGHGSQRTRRKTI